MCLLCKVLTRSPFCKVEPLLGRSWPKSRPFPRLAQVGQIQPGPNQVSVMSANLSGSPFPGDADASDRRDALAGHATSVVTAGCASVPASGAKAATHSILTEWGTMSAQLNPTMAHIRSAPSGVAPGATLSKTLVPARLPATAPVAAHNARHCN